MELRLAGGFGMKIARIRKARPSTLRCAIGGVCDRCHQKIVTAEHVATVYAVNQHTQQVVIVGVGLVN
jgi:hypothetical protein